MHGRGWKKNGARPRRRCGRDTNKFLRNRSTIYANDDDSGVCASVHSTPSHQHVSFVHRISATVINWVHVVHIRIPRPVLYHRNHNAHWTIIVVVVIRGRCEQNERMPPPTRWNADSSCCCCWGWWWVQRGRGAMLHSANTQRQWQLLSSSRWRVEHRIRPVDWNSLLCCPLTTTQSTEAAAAIKGARVMLKGIF